MTGDVVINVQHISKRYELRHPVVSEDGSVTKQLWALNDVSFGVRKGERIGIIGANGSGKSTLLKILSGITKPSSGTASIIGRVASILDIGAGFHTELTGKENIFLNGQLLGFDKKEIREKYNEIIAFSGIERFIDEPVKHYSNGMYLRLAFSIMAHLDFDIYLLDEVLSVGDTSFQLKVNNFLQQKIATGQGTFIFVSHNLSELRMLCDRFYLLDNGQLHEDHSKELVEEYISDSFGLAETGLPFNRAMLSDNDRLLNEFVEVKEVYANAGEQEYIEESGVLAFYCNVKIKKECAVDVSFGVEDLLGKELFYVSTLITGHVNEYKTIDAGHVLIRVELPPYTLKKAQYILNLTLVANGQRILISRQKCLYFKINSLQQAEDKLVEQRPDAPIVRGNWSYIWERGEHV